MTVSEIIAELPNLSEAERRQILSQIRELDGQPGEIGFTDDLILAACRRIDEREKTDAARFLHEAAEQTFEALDREEVKNAGRKNSRG